MYVSITGNKGNQDVYIKQSYRKENGKTSSRIYKKLGKYNDLLAQFSGDETAMMDWAKKEVEKETLLYNQRREKVTVSFSPACPYPTGRRASLQCRLSVPTAALHRSAARQHLQKYP